MKKIREMMEDALFLTAVSPLVLFLCAVYWLYRLFRIDLNDEF